MPDASERRAETIRDLGTLRLRSVRDGDTHIVALAGEFDFATVEGVQRELQRVEDTDAQVIVLDLRELEFIDAKGLEVIIMAHCRAARRLVIVKGARRVQRVFEICDLVRLLPLTDKPPHSSDGAAAPERIDANSSKVGLGAAATRRAAAVRRANQAALASAVRDLRSHGRLGGIR